MKNNLKTMLIWVVTMGALLLGTAAHSATADPVLTTGYATLSTNSVTNGYVIFPAENSSTLRLVDIVVTNNPTGDANGFLLFGSGVSHTRLLTNCGATATNFTIISNSLIASNDWVILQRASDGHCTLLNVWTNYGTNIAFTGQVGLAVTNNDYLYLLGRWRTNMTGIAEYNQRGECLYPAQLRMPMLIRIFNTNTAFGRIDRAVVKYDTGQ